MNEIGLSFDPQSDTFTLNFIFELKFIEHADIIASIVMIVRKEGEVEAGLAEING
jgi:hypothetical protein